MATWSVSLITATLILTVGLIDDLRSRKFHNWLFITCTVVAFLVSGLTSGLEGLQAGLLGFMAGFGLLLPLVMIRAVGAGDLKLLAAFGAATTWDATLSVALYSLFWGAAFGVIRVVLAGQSAAFARNIMTLVVWRRAEGLELHKIPYTVALLLGWLSYLTFRGLI